MEKQMVEALKRLAKATDDVVALWNKGVELNDFNSIKSYPYHRSLDELACDVSKWVEEVADEVEARTYVSKLREALREEGI